MYVSLVSRSNWKQLIDELLKYAGNSVRHGDLYSNKSWISKSSSIIRGLKGVENIYTQHQPLLAQILEKATTAGGLKEIEFPVVSGSVPKRAPKDIYVFIAGGTTYEEAAYVAQFNGKSASKRVILGGTTIHNSTSYVFLTRPLI
jgi:hypothetical protein